MKSNKQRRTEIKTRRMERAEAALRVVGQERSSLLPIGAIAADPDRLAHNNTYGLLPNFYVDQLFQCRDCRVESVWTAKQQKWWYEALAKPIHSRAARCLACRRARRALIQSQGDAALKLRHEVRALRELGSTRPTADARRQVAMGLASKWDGIRMAAAKTLQRWGDPESMTALQQLLDLERARPRYSPLCYPLSKLLQ